MSQSIATFRGVAPKAPWPQLATDSAIELSVVIPCLNEADTLAVCIEAAQKGLREAGTNGEIIVADNGSTDGSIEIAVSCGARVVNVPRRGYGSALQAGIASAKGRYVLMGDADDSYDFTQLPRFLQLLRDGFELVQGCRFPAGGGTIEEGAMPFLHRWFGNPALSAIARWWFRTPITDIYCGMRGFTRDLYNRLNLHSPGMEFATEMIIKASVFQAGLAEVPITLRKDGRKAHPPHLRTFRDGWRTLRLFLMHSPRWLFLEPGKWLMLLGLIGYVLALPGLHIGTVHFGLNTLALASLALLCGQQAVLFAIASKSISVRTGLCPPDTRLQRLMRIFTLERGLGLGAGAIVAGGLLVLSIFIQWQAAHFGDLDYDFTLRRIIPGFLLCASGVQLVLASFLVRIVAPPEHH